MVLATIPHTALLSSTLSVSHQGSFNLERMDGAGKINGIRSLITGAAVAVFAGCLLIWVMAPTAVYKQTWLPQIRADTNSTYFGTQGAMILLYTFPILFFAVLGCAYLHLATTYPTNTISSNHKWHKQLAVWKRPMIVKGLGIVSRIELAFFVMFIALLVWSFSTYLHVSFKQITPQSAATNGEKVWEAKLDSAALRLGLVGNICLAFMFFPVTRGSSVLPLFGLTSEASVRYHIWLGHIVMTLFTAHGICYLIYWTVTHQLSVQMVQWSNAGVANVPGELALLCGLVLWVTTFPLLRRRKFEIFFYAHHLYILFILFFILHVGIIYACMMLPGFYLFVVDRFLRFLQSRRGVRLVSARILPCKIVELNFSKGRGLSYTPTSTMFVNVPGISKLQWHPFTVSSSSNLEPEKLSVIIKGEGSWSKKLYQMVSSPNSSLDHLAVSTEGPYGPVSTDFLRHDIMVMVSGGSGITPLISITRELMFLSETLKQKTPKLLFICAFRNSADLTMLDLLLPISGSPLLFPNLDLQIEAYVTREKEPTTGNQKLIRTVWFKPKASDSLISPVLGPNSWLWLGAIITSSFIIFLLFMGILTRYYIYPIDHNTNNVYSYSSRAVLNILFICICIASTATAAFYWNKKQGVRETNQILNMEGATPVASPTSSWLYNADRELESLPQQTLFQSTKVQYGERPDLKKILFERKEASIGVLVSGPNGMRHEVAKICSSGLADNLHFESISFTW